MILSKYLRIFSCVTNIFRNKISSRIRGTGYAISIVKDYRSDRGKNSRIRHAWRIREISRVLGGPKKISRNDSNGRWLKPVEFPGNVHLVGSANRSVQSPIVAQWIIPRYTRRTACVARKLHSNEVDVHRSSPWASDIIVHCPVSSFCMLIF